MPETGNLQKLFGSYERLQNQHRFSSDLTLPKFVETYAVNLPAMVRGFPRGNLDMEALGAHYWDRLKEFYKYEEFEEVSLDSAEDARFLNQAIKMAEDWFYQGEWTECLSVPTHEQLEKALLGKQNKFLGKVRAQEKNLGRDRLGQATEPLPDIFKDAAAGEDLVEIYNEHAFKFFHSPAAAINTLTKIESKRKIEVNDAKFKGLIRQTRKWSEVKIDEWRSHTTGTRLSELDEGTLKESINFMDQVPTYIRLNPASHFKRNLFFMKTVLIAAELIRRTGEGKLTLNGFEQIMQLMRREIEKAEKEHRNATYLYFDFAGGNGKDKPYSQSSILHVNSKELPAALIAVDYMRQKNEENKQ